MTCTPGDCCGYYRLSGSTNDQPTAPGTNCKNGGIVFAADCPVGSCVSPPPAQSTLKPTSAATQTPTQPATQAPTQPATQAPTQPATQAPTQTPTKVPITITPAPTSAPTSAPSSGSSGCSLSQIFSQQDFNTLFPYANGAATRGDANQHAIFNYTYLIDAAQLFPTFACTGDITTRKRELAAFLAQTSQESSGWWSGQPYNWGFFFSTEVGCTASTCAYCSGATGAMACAPGQGYYGRGPIQLSWNYNYYQASMAIFGTPILLQQPDQVFAAGGTAFSTALWFWMTAQSPKPSAHAVMTGGWIPSAADISANRYPGFGMVTNIVNGGIECNPSATAPLNRIGYFSAYTQYMGITMGNYVSCANQLSY